MCVRAQFEDLRLSVQIPVSRNERVEQVTHRWHHTSSCGEDRMHEPRLCRKVRQQAPQPT
jgi:hypothetical protein